MRRKITLLGGFEATISWDNKTKEGDIIYPNAEFLTYIHAHTRQDASEKAATIAPHVRVWHHTM